MEKPPLEIAAVIPMTGRLSHIGFEVRNGAQIAIDQINAAGGVNGRRVEMTVLDNQGSPEITDAHLQQLYNDDVPVVLGPIMSAMTDVVKRASDAPYLIVSPTMTTNALSGIKDNFVRLTPTNDSETRVLAERIRADGYGRAAIIYDKSNPNYTEEVVRNFTDFFVGLDGEVAIATGFEADSNDGYVEAAERAIESDVDALLLVCTSTDAAAIAQQIWKWKQDVCLYGTVWTNGTNLAVEGGRAVDGMVIVSVRGPADDSPRYVEFANEHKRRFGAAPELDGVYGYDAIQIVLGVMNGTGIEDRDELVEAVVGRTYKTLTGQLRIDEFGDAHQKVFLTRVEYQGAEGRGGR